MSTITVAPVVQPSPGVSKFLALFNQIIYNNAVGFVQVAADVAAGQKVSAISDGLNAAVTTISTINPVWGADAALANAAAQEGIALIVGFVSLFHKPKAAAPAVATAAVAK